MPWQKARHTKHLVTPSIDALDDLEKFCGLSLQHDQGSKSESKKETDEYKPIPGKDKQQEHPCISEQ
jgi:hypothetical protein